MQVQVLVFGTFWKFLLNIFCPWLPEFADTDPVFMENILWVIDMKVFSNL